MHFKTYIQNYFSQDDEDFRALPESTKNSILEKKMVPTLLDRCLKLYTTLWNIWTYQQLCKNITQLVCI